jgi:monoamine oxidase
MNFKSDLFSRRNFMVKSSESVLALAGNTLKIPSREVSDEEPRSVDVVVVGAGLSGIHAASILSSYGIKCTLLDAMSTPGGRMATWKFSHNANNYAFELGATWHWPDKQPKLKKLISDLGIKTFTQYSDGTIWVERFRFEKAQKYASIIASPSLAMRPESGFSELINLMIQKLPSNTFWANSNVSSIKIINDEQVNVEINRGTRQSKKIACKAVILAIPPRTLFNIDIQPSMPDFLKKKLAQIPTWLGGQAKAIAVYETPFWRDNGHSGWVSSLIGPLQEIYDTSPVNDLGALFGLFGISHRERNYLGVQKIEQLVLEQLTRLFGSKAANPIEFMYYDWARERSIASAADFEMPVRYTEPIKLSNEEITLQKKIFFAGTELANEHNGYLEGALISSERVANLLLNKFGKL